MLITGSVCDEVGEGAKVINIIDKRVEERIPAVLRLGFVLSFAWQYLCRDCHPRVGLDVSSWATATIASPRAMVACA